MAFVLIILVSCFEPNIYRTNLIKKENTPLSSESNNKITYVDSPPITILNDTAFSVNYVFPGDGSSATPYLIQSYNISGMYPYGIFIYNTTKHFIIQDCNIESVDYGIYLLNVTSSTGQIKSNIITNTTSYTMGLANANGTVIFNNNMSKNWNNAIGVDWSNNVTVQQNYVALNNGTGLQFNRSRDILIFNNTFDNNLQSGVDFYNTSMSTIYNNTFSYNYYGLRLITSITKYNLIYYNQFITNAFPALDNGRLNLFYNSTSYQGNYWSSNIAGLFFIPGSDNSRDYFPLDINMGPFIMSTTGTSSSGIPVTVTQNITTTTTTTQTTTSNVTFTTNATSIIQSIFFLLNKTTTTNATSTIITTTTKTAGLSLIGISLAIPVAIFVNRKKHKKP